jgi:hypothetical protein
MISITKMPILRKVSAQAAAAWDVAKTPAPRAPDDRYTWVERPAILYLSGKPRSLHDIPRVGDVVRLDDPTATLAQRITGVVLQVRIRKGGVWTHVQLAVDGSVQWVSKRQIAAHLGRIKGVSRIDQPTKSLHNRTHGGTHSWFVRVYEGKRPRIARSFSDQAAGGQVAALKAALAFHAAHVETGGESGIPFP